MRNVSSNPFTGGARGEYAHGRIGRGMGVITAWREAVSVCAGSKGRRRHGLRIRNGEATGAQAAGIRSARSRTPS